MMAWSLLPVLLGALYWNNFQYLARRHGFGDPLLATRGLSIGFNSATYRLFKLDGLEPGREDYGQAVVYRGGMTLDSSVDRSSALELCHGYKR
jgi:hypothetical protein